MSDQRDGGISWTDETWNPIRGCSRVSEGCRNCYAEKVAARFSGPGLAYEGLVSMGAKGGRWNGAVRLVEEHLGDPLRWSRPRRIFVNSMSDLFHENVPREVVAAVLGVIAMSGHHTHQLLTKRPARMRELMGSITLEEAIEATLRFGVDVPPRVSVAIGRTMREMGRDVSWEGPYCDAPWLHLGVSVEDQATADARIPLLLQTRAAVRWVSYEPALGPVDLGLQSATCACCSRWSSRWVKLDRPVHGDWFHAATRAPAGVYRAKSNQHGALTVAATNGFDLGIRPAEFEALPGLDWVVVGGESGPGARPFDLAWARSVIQQGRAAGTAVFVKQLGARPVEIYSGPAIEQSADSIARHGEYDPEVPEYEFRDRKGGDPDEWPDDLRVRQWPEARA